ncbi:MAG: acetyl-CoA hydrolase/transferase family protein [Syntrophales bacterium]
MNHSPYIAEYERKLTTPEKAVEQIRHGATLVHGPAIAEPPALLAAIAQRARAGDLREIKVYSFFPMATAIKTVLAVDLCDVIRSYTWFVSGADRSLVRVGLSYFVPNYFHQIPRLCRDFMDIDVVVTTVSPMDDTGHFSFGTANDFISTAARCSKKLIVEVNRHMPRVFGDSLLHLSEVDAIVENHLPLPEPPLAEPEPEDGIISRQIAELIPDGATIQLGFGSLPAAVANHLGGHRDLGIHTELFCPSMAELIRKGAATGRRKTLHPLKHVFTVALGTREMYEFMNDNPSMESYPVSYVNDPAVIARNDQMISVNSVLEVDLLGQCNAESIAGHQFSGTGGQLDFVRGAFNSRGGKSFLAFYSTAKNGTISRVVPRLDTGAVITTPRMDTHYLVTEYGLVNLKGKCTRERALDIISIAHPRFRDDLLREAEKMYLL